MNSKIVPNVFKRKNSDFHVKNMNPQQLRFKKFVTCNPKPPAIELITQNTNKENNENTNQIKEELCKIISEFLSNFVENMREMDDLTNELTSFKEKYDKRCLEFSKADESSLNSIRSKISELKVEMKKNKFFQTSIQKNLQNTLENSEKLKEESKIENLKIKILQERLGVIFPYNQQLNKQIISKELENENRKIEIQQLVKKCCKENLELLNDLEQKNLLLKKIDRAKLNKHIFFYFL